MTLFLVLHISQQALRLHHPTVSSSGRERTYTKGTIENLAEPLAAGAENILVHVVGLVVRNYLGIGILARLEELPVSRREAHSRNSQGHSLPIMQLLVWILALGIGHGRARRATRRQCRSFSEHRVEAIGNVLVHDGRRGSWSVGHLEMMNSRKIRGRISWVKSEVDKFEKMRTVEVESGGDCFPK